MQRMEAQLRMFQRKNICYLVKDKSCDSLENNVLLSLSYEFLEAKLKTNKIIYLVKEISRQLNTDSNYMDISLMHTYK